MTGTINPWDKLPNESPKRYHASSVIYCLARIGSIMKAVRQHYGNNPDVSLDTRSRVWERFSSAHNWVARATDHAS